jgi:hypothetical protein
LPARSLTASCKDFRREWRAKPVRIRRVQPLGPASRPRAMCGRARLSYDVTKIKLVFSIPPDRPTPNIAPSWDVAPTDPPRWGVGDETGWSEGPRSNAEEVIE